MNDMYAKLGNQSKLGRIKRHNLPQLMLLHEGSMINYHIVDRASLSPTHLETGFE